MCKPDRNTAVMIIKHKIRRAIDRINIKGKLAICLCTGISLGIFFSEESCSRKDLAESFDQEPLDLHIVIGAEVRKPLFLMDHCIGWSGLDHLLPASRIRRSIARYLESIRSFGSSLISGVAFSPIASETERSMDGFSVIAYVPEDFCSSSADLHGVTSQPPNLRIALSIFLRLLSNPQYQIPPRSPPTVLKNRSASWKVPSLKNN